MIKYLFGHSIATLLFFMVWLTNSGRPGGEVGMSPFVLAIMLACQLGIGIVLSLIFRKKLRSRKDFGVGLLVYLVIFELVFIFWGDKPPIFEIFNPTYENGVGIAFSVSSMIGGLVIWILIRKKEKTFGNN